MAAGCRVSPAARRGSEAANLGEFAYRISGSADLYEATARRSVASINFVTAHDGFTLRDLLSHNDKHNDANGEGNNDGESHNRSWNCGVEGPTSDPRGRRVVDDSFVMRFNAHHEPFEFTIPPAEFGSAWQPVVDTAGPGEVSDATPVKAADAVRVQARAMIVLREIN